MHNLFFPFLMFLFSAIYVSFDKLKAETVVFYLFKICVFYRDSFFVRFCLSIGLNMIKCADIMRKNVCKDS